VLGAKAESDDAITRVRCFTTLSPKLKAVLLQLRDREQVCRLGSVKIGGREKTRDAAEITSNAEKGSSPSSC